MAMGKGDWLHMLAQPAWWAFLILGALPSDVVSPVSGLFWGRERELLTLAWSHTLGSASSPTLLLVAPAWSCDCFKAHGAGNQRPGGVVRQLWQPLCLPRPFRSNGMGNNTASALFCAMCQRQVLKTHPAPPSMGCTNHLHWQGQGR